MRIGRGVTLLVLSFLATGCDLDVSNPNALPQQEVLSTANGVIALAVGIQDLFAESVEEFVQAPALVTDEWGTGTRSLLSYRTLLSGQGVDDDLGVVEEPWASAYRVVNTANDLIGNAPNAGISPPGAATGVVAIAKLFKAMAFGTIIQQFERIVLDPANPRLESREVVLDTVLALLESARSDVAGLNDSDRSFLQSRILGTGFNFASTVDAMLARYYLIDGQHQKAIEAAERVDLSVRSVIPFTAPDVNRICNLSQCGLQYVFPLASFVRQAESGDRRPEFWVDVDAQPFTGNPDSLLLPLQMYGERSDPFLVYVPDEMTLIRAEAHARLGNLARARDLINEVRTRTTVEPIAALPALPEEALDTPAELFRQIAHERRYELYEQGLRWEDLRRLEPFVTERPSIAWLPTPRQECVNNPGVC
jgi:hypothetical protein